MKKPEIKAEIAEMRAKTDLLGGSAVMELLEKRQFLAAVKRAAPAELPRNSDLWQSIKVTENGTEFRLPDKLAAIKLDNDLSGHGFEAEANKAISVVVRRAWNVGN